MHHPTSRLFCTNLPLEVTDSVLSVLFQQYDPISSLLLYMFLIYNQISRISFYASLHFADTRQENGSGDLPVSRACNCSKRSIRRVYTEERLDNVGYICMIIQNASRTHQLSVLDPPSLERFRLKTCTRTSSK